MSDLLFKINLHYEVIDATECDIREALTEALNKMCSGLKSKVSKTFITYKIKEVIDLS